MSDRSDQYDLNLTLTECSLLRTYAESATLDEAARTLSMPASTAGGMIGRILSKMDLSNARQAVYYHFVYHGNSGKCRSQHE